MKKYAILLLTLLTLTTCESDDPIQYKLSTKVNPPDGGTISPSSGTFDQGEEITFEATPSEQYVFKNWSDDASGDDNPMTTVMADDMFVTANFEKRTYSLSVHITGEGRVRERIVPAKSTDYPSGTTVQLTALPREGWEFVRWYGGVESTANPIEISMTEAMTIMCVFDFINKERVYVPDDNFERAIREMGLDHHMDDYVYVELIKNVTELNLENRQIDDLTGIEGFGELNTLILSNNNLSSLDVSQNNQLHTLVVENNQLTSLDLSENVIFGTVNIRGNPIQCLQVSSVQIWWNSTGDEEWLIADEGVVASVDCSINEEDLTFIPDDRFEQALINMGLDEALDDYVRTIDILNISGLDLSGQNISDLTGLKDFKALLNLDVSNNNLQSMDISHMRYYHFIDIRNNPLNCVQVSETQLNAMGGLSYIWVDDGVELALDCAD